MAVGRVNVSGKYRVGDSLLYDDVAPFMVKSYKPLRKLKWSLGTSYADRSNYQFFRLVNNYIYTVSNDLKSIVKIGVEGSIISTLSITHNYLIGFDANAVANKVMLLVSDVIDNTGYLRVEVYNLNLELENTIILQSSGAVPPISYCQITNDCKYLWVYTDEKYVTLYDLVNLKAIKTESISYKYSTNSTRKICLDEQGNAFYLSEQGYAYYSPIVGSRNVITPLYYGNGTITRKKGVTYACWCSNSAKDKIALFRLDKSNEIKIYETSVVSSSYYPTSIAVDIDAELIYYAVSQTGISCFSVIEGKKYVHYSDNYSYVAYIEAIDNIGDLIIYNVNKLSVYSPGEEQKGYVIIK